MGQCTAFGPEIREGCDHPMVAASDACYCEDCGVVCRSKFEGCRTVWAGTQPVPASFVERPKATAAPASPAAQNGAAAVGSGHEYRSDEQTNAPPGPATVRVGAESIAAIEAALASLSTELRAAASRIEQLDSDVHAALARNRDALTTLADRVKKLEAPPRAFPPPRPPASDPSPRPLASPGAAATPEPVDLASTRPEVHPSRDIKLHPHAD